MLEIIVASALSFAAGGGVGYFLARHPRKVGQQDRDAGLRAYQKMKNGR